MSKKKRVPKQNNKELITNTSAVLEENVTMTKITFKTIEEAKAYCATEDPDASIEFALQGSTFARFELELENNDLICIDTPHNVYNANMLNFDCFEVFTMVDNRSFQERALIAEKEVTYLFNKVDKLTQEKNALEDRMIKQLSEQASEINRLNLSNSALTSDLTKAKESIVSYQTRLSDFRKSQDKETEFGFVDFTDAIINSILQKPSPCELDTKMKALIAEVLSKGNISISKEFMNQLLHELNIDIVKNPECLTYENIEATILSMIKTGTGIV